MPKESSVKPLCIDALRYAEYYGMQETFDNLYAKSKAGETFTNLLDIVLSRENILLAYRNVKANIGSKTTGTDGLTIQDIGRVTPEEMVKKVQYIVSGKKNGYTPKPVRIINVPKVSDPTQSDPLGIPCIWDRIVQQCIKQVLEPICEAKFSNNSFGLRPQRNTEHAIASTYKMLQLNNLHFTVEFGINRFFDNVNHSKLLRQIWTLGIHDKHLIGKIKRLLNTPMQLPDGSLVLAKKGLPQTGILASLLTNIVLNELDEWVDSQWQNHPLVQKHCYPNPKRPGHLSRQYGYSLMRKTSLKEMYIVRYADEFRIFCRTKTDAERAKVAVSQWLKERLKLDVIPEKTKVVNVRRHYSEFLGFKIKVRHKSGKMVVTSHMNDEQMKKANQDLPTQAKRIARPRAGKTETDELRLYNAMVMERHNYFKKAVNIYQDCQRLSWRLSIIFYNRLKHRVGNRLSKKGRPLASKERQLYGDSKMLRYLTGSGEPIYPYGYIKHRNPVSMKRTVNCYTPEGRQSIHNNLGLNVSLMLKLMKQTSHGRSIEYTDNRISLFSAQDGKCAVTGNEFGCTDDIHCHHVVPRSMGGSDKIQNLILVSENVHRLIHATSPAIIRKYLESLSLDSEQLSKVNLLRSKAHLQPIPLF